MERILLVMNAYKVDWKAIEFAYQMSAVTKSKVAALLINNHQGEYIPEDFLSASAFFEYKSKRENIVKSSAIVDTNQGLKKIAEFFQSKNIMFEIFICNGDPIETITNESRFADLLIFDPEITFYDEKGQIPSLFTKEVLASAECPIILAPTINDELKEVVFCYDGSESSVFAIKQFTYLFSEFTEMKATLLQVNKSYQKGMDGEHYKINDWLKAHYKNLVYHELVGSVSEELFKYFFRKRGVLVVMGAYGRSVVSNFLRRSSAEMLIKTIDLPLFITH